MGDSRRQAASQRFYAQTNRLQWLKWIGVCLGVALSGPTHALLEELPPVVITGTRDNAGYLWDRPGSGGGRDGGNPYDSGDRGDGGTEVVDTTPRRKEPGCKIEAGALQKTISEARQAAMSRTVPPGKEIMAGTQWANPAYAAKGWSKWQDYKIIHDISDGVMRRYTVNVHYMYNNLTGQLDDFKLVNKLEDGCVGKVQSA
jgi:hypothetical protein